MLNIREKRRLCRVVGAYLLAACAWPLLLVGAPAAEEMRPVAVFCCASLDKLHAGVGLLGEVSGNATLPAALERFLKRTTSLESLEGLDSGRPIGAVIGSDGLHVVFMALVPVRDAGQFLRELQPAVGEVREIGNEVWKIGRREWTGFVKHRRGWLYVAQTEENLAWMPAPEEMLNGHARSFDVVLELNLQRVPDEFRTMAVDVARLALRARLARREGESEAAHRLRSHLTSWQFHALEQLLTESGRMTCGFKLDGQRRLAQVDLYIEPLPRSSLAERAESLRQNGCRFILGNEESMLRGHARLLLDSRQRESVREELEALAPVVDALLAESDWFASTEDRQVCQGLAAALREVAAATVRSGRVDVGLVVQGEKPPVTLLAGAHVQQGTTLDTSFERLAALGRQHPRYAGFKADVGRVGEQRLHAIELAADGAWKELLGPEPRLLLAFTPDAVWMAAGPGAQAALSEKLAAAPQPAASAVPVEFVVRLKQLADSAAPLAKGTSAERGLALLKGQLRQCDDRVRIALSSGEGRLHLQLTGHEGVLKLGALGLGLQLLLAQ